jgi:hypothetical protein
MSDVAACLDALRIVVAEVEALVSLAVDAFDTADWRGVDPHTIERMASVLGVIARSAGAAVDATNRLQGAVADAQPAPAGESWGGDGTASAPGEGMSPQDAEIVRRIRERCPDSRYDGGSADELIQLFQRNKRVLDRSDEDVIAAMTQPR